MDNDVQDKASAEDIVKSIKRDQQGIPKQLSNFREEFEKKVYNKGLTLSLETVFQETKSSVDFSLYYCLSETLNQCERAIKEKPSRELSLVKTKLQEALFWLNQSS